MATPTLIFKFELTALKHGQPPHLEAVRLSRLGEARPKPGDWSASIKRGRQAG
jgi:hypothetical protein